MFILYVRCTRINPADPGIMEKFGVVNVPKTHNINLPANFGSIETGTRSSPLSTCRSSVGGHSSTKDAAGVARIEVPSGPPRKRSHSFCFVGAFFYLLFVKDDCRKQQEGNDQQTVGEDALFCTLCNAEVRFCDLMFLNKLDLLC